MWWGRSALIVGGFAALLYGLALLWTDHEAFRVWIAEDGLPESFTALALAAGAAYAADVASRFLRQEERKRALSWGVIAAALLFGCLEEISYGQRIFGWQSPDWFQLHNAQQETNLHNLAVAGVKINRLVFGKGLALLIVAYLLVLPWLYGRSARFAARIDQLSFPLPRAYQVALWLTSVAFVRVGLAFEGRAAELQEMMGAVLFWVILLDPRNAAAALPAANRSLYASVAPRGSVQRRSTPARSPIA